MKFKTFIENKNPREPGSLNWEERGTFDFMAGTGLKPFQFVQSNDRYYEIINQRANRNYSKKIEDINGIAHDGFEIYVTKWDGKKPVFKTRKKIAKIVDKENTGDFSPLRMKHLYEKEVVPFIVKHFSDTQNSPF